MPGLHLVFDEQYARGLIVVDFQPTDSIGHFVIFPPVLGSGRAVIDAPITVGLGTELRQLFRARVSGLMVEGEVLGISNTAQ